MHENQNHTLLMSMELQIPFYPVLPLDFKPHILERYYDLLYRLGHWGLELSNLSQTLTIMLSIQSLAIN